MFQTLVRENRLIWFIAFFSVFNLYLAVFNALPLKVGYLSTDGRRMLDLVRNTPQGQRFSALYGCSVSTRKGIRPRDLEPMLIDRILSIPEASMEHISGLLTAYFVALDKGQIERAGNYLDQALDNHAYYPELFRGSLLLEGTYFESHIRHQPDVARKWFNKIQEKALIEPYSLLRAEAALLLAEGDVESAQDKARQGLVDVQRDSFMIGHALAEQEWLQALHQEIAQT